MLFRMINGCWFPEKIQRDIQHDPVAVIEYHPVPLVIAGCGSGLFSMLRFFAGMFREKCVCMLTFAYL